MMANKFPLINVIDFVCYWSNLTFTTILFIQVQFFLYEQGNKLTSDSLHTKKNNCLLWLWIFGAILSQIVEFVLNAGISIFCHRLWQWHRWVDVEMYFIFNFNYKCVAYLQYVVPKISSRKSENRREKSNALKIWKTVFLEKRRIVAFELRAITKPHKLCTYVL